MNVTTVVLFVLGWMVAVVVTELVRAICGPENTACTAALNELVDGEWHDVRTLRAERGILLQLEFDGCVECRWNVERRCHEWRIVQ